MKAHMQHVAQLSQVRAAAKSKWDELDVDHNGWLDTNEIQSLASWVWATFSDEPMSKEENEALVRKIMRQCDENNDNVIDRGEFLLYYERAFTQMTNIWLKNSNATRIDKQS